MCPITSHQDCSMTKNISLSHIQQTKLISVDGGTINLMGMGHFTIPTGSLSVPTEIGVKLYHQNNGIILCFAPHGTVFKYPARLTIFHEFWELLKNSSVFTIYYKAHPSSQWQPASFGKWAETPEGVEVQIPHFSSYYFSRREVYPVSSRNVDRENEKQPKPDDKAARNRDDVDPGKLHQIDDRVTQDEDRVRDNDTLKSSTSN